MPRDATFLRDIFPPNLTLFTIARTSISADDPYVGWTIAVFSQDLLPKKRWAQLWKSVDDRIHLGYNALGDGVEVVEAGKESYALAKWKNVMRSSDYTGKVETGSIASIEEAIGMSCTT